MKFCTHMAYIFVGSYTKFEVDGLCPARYRDIAINVKWGKKLPHFRHEDEYDIAKFLCLVKISIGHDREFNFDSKDLFYQFSPNPLIGRIGKDRAPAKQSLLRWPCPLPSDRAIPGLWQNLESKVKRTHIAAHGRSLSLTSTGYGLPPTATIPARMLDKHRAPVAPRTLHF